MSKLFHPVLFFIVSLLYLIEGESVENPIYLNCPQELKRIEDAGWLSLRLSPAFEAKILLSIGLEEKVRSPLHYRQALKALGLKPQYQYPEESYVYLESVEALKEDLALFLSEEEISLFLEEFQKREKWQNKEGKILYPVQHWVIYAVFDSEKTVAKF